MKSILLMKFKLGSLSGLFIIMSIIFIHPAWAQNFRSNIPSQSRNQDLNQNEPNYQNIEALLATEGVVPGVVPSFDPVSNSRYTLGVRDVIRVEVLRHPEVSGEFAINSEGKIQYEFLGDIAISGLTKQEVTELLQEKLSKFIIDPQVNIKITGFNSKVVYVIGEVGRPGKINMQGDTITIREALVQAGLPLLTAKTTKGMLITPTADGNPEQVRINVHKLLYQGDLRENLVMKPGDTLYVPPTVMAKALRVLQPVAQPIGTASGTTRTVTGF